MKLTEQRSSTLHGVLLITLFACAAFYIGDMGWVKALSLSPMVVGIILGMLYANSLRNNLPDTWVPGIAFCGKRVLRFGIILYGFRLTFQDVVAVGLPAIVVDAIIVCGTILLGVLVGRLLKMDRSLYRAGVFDLSPDAMGIFAGSTIHEVAQVVGAGDAMGAAVSNSAIIVKMIRVMMLVPVLLVIAFFVAKNVAERGEEGNGGSTINIPWFAILFLVVIGFNSLNLLPKACVDFINTFDTFLLTMAMSALGAETSIDKFKKAGFKPFLLATILWCWLIGGGYCLAKYVVPLMGVGC